MQKIGSVGLSSCCKQRFPALSRLSKRISTSGGDCPDKQALQPSLVSLEHPLHRSTMPVLSRQKYLMIPGGTTLLHPSRVGASPQPQPTWTNTTRDFRPVRFERNL